MNIRFPVKTKIFFVEPDFRMDDEKIQIRNKYAALGFLCERHPMTIFNDRIKGKDIIKAKNLHKYTGKHVNVASLLITVKVVHTKNGVP